MKATRQEPEKPFVPVTLVLETQEEVDAIHAVFNHYGICRAVGLSENTFKVTQPYRDSEKSDSKHTALCKILK